MLRSRLRSSLWLWACLALALAVVLSLAPWRSAPSPESDLQSYADATVAHGVPGVAIVVTRGDVVASLVTSGDMSPDAEISVASLSKAFTATAVMQLVERGDISLDDPVRQHLPTFTLDDPRGSEITVRQLLNQSTGLTDRTIGFDQYRVDPGDSAGVLSLLETSRLAYDPGTSWDYCNVNYWIATALVEAVTGRDFGDYLEHEILEPLGMDHTRYSAVSGPGAGTVDTHSWAFGHAVSLPTPQIYSAGAGGITTTIDDLGRWLRFQHGEGNEVLSRASLDELHRRQSPLHEYPVGYALGWWSGEPADGGVPRTSHSGSGAGISAYAGLFPGDVGIAVLMNSSSPRADLVAADVLSVLDGGSAPPREPPAAWPDVLALGVAALLVLAVGRGAWSAMRRTQWRWGSRVATLALLVVPGIGFVPAILGSLVGRQANWTVLFHTLPVPTLSIAAVVCAAVLLAVIRIGRDIGSTQKRLPQRATWSRPDEPTSMTSAAHGGGGAVEEL